MTINAGAAIWEFGTPVDVIDETPGGIIAIGDWLNGSIGYSGEDTGVSDGLLTLTLSVAAGEYSSIALYRKLPGSPDPSNNAVFQYVQNFPMEQGATAQSVAISDIPVTPGQQCVFSLRNDTTSSIAAAAVKLTLTPRAQNAKV